MATTRASAARLPTILAATIITLCVAWTWRPVLDFPFLNWDDDAVIVRNTSLAEPDVVAWAFSTTYMEHYQPGAWLVWAALRRTAGLTPQAFHAANVVAHLACTLLIWLAGRRLLAWHTSASPAVRERAAGTAALLFGVHPLFAEPVAWISALPYPLALAPAIGSLLAWLHAEGRHDARARAIALLLFALSLAVRPLAIGLPVVLATFDAWVRQHPARTVLRRLWPFALLAIVGAALEAVARSAVVNDLPWLFRLETAAVAPFLHLAHLFAPGAVAPIDMLPLRPQASLMAALGAVIALVVATAIAWRVRRALPAVAIAWFSYVALLAPASGLVSTGLQISAPRYAYTPAVVVALVLALGLARLGRATVLQAGLGLTAGAAVALGAFTAREALRPWADSTSLWTTAIASAPGNDVAHYNLALALEAADRDANAAIHYREALTLNPAHAEARANLARLDAARLESEGNALASRGDLAAAAERYQQALTLDPARTHARAGLGMALAMTGRVDDAIPALREALDEGTPDPAVPATLSVLLLQSDRIREARDVLETGLARRPNDVGITHNLARLLATTGTGPADRTRALRLALSVVEATGGRDARAFDTLAEALAANGRDAEADTARTRAVAVARAQGEMELAVQIAARGRVNRRPGPG